MNVILIGYMGSGKSSVGRKLTQVLGYKYLDLDDYIEKIEGKTISEIFKNKGEIYFRKIETKYLSEVISNTNETIISLGGGTPCYGQNMELIKNAKNATSIYLRASVASLADRLFLAKNKRPLISHIENKEALKDFIAKHLFERSVFYSQSDITINTDQKTIDEVIESILLNLY
jgi:shikimate kinase